MCVCVAVSGGGGEAGQGTLSDGIYTRPKSADSVCVQDLPATILSSHRQWFEE